MAASNSMRGITGSCANAGPAAPAPKTSAIAINRAGFAPPDHDASGVNLSRSALRVNFGSALRVNFGSALRVNFGSALRVNFGSALRLDMIRSFNAVTLVAALLRRFPPRRHRSNHDIQQGDEEDRQERRSNHAAHDGGADGVPGAGAGPRGDDEREHTEDERERRHENRPQPYARGLDGRVDNRQAL